MIQLILKVNKKCNPKFIQKFTERKLILNIKSKLVEKFKCLLLFIMTVMKTQGA